MGCCTSGRHLRARTRVRRWRYGACAQLGAGQIQRRLRTPSGVSCLGTWMPGCQVSSAHPLAF